MGGRISITAAVTFSVGKNKRILAILLILWLAIPPVPVVNVSLSGSQASIDEVTTTSGDPSNVLQLHMNEGIGRVAYDSSSYQNNGDVKAHQGAISGAPWVYGNSGKALDFESTEGEKVRWSDPRYQKVHVWDTDACKDETTKNGIVYCHITNWDGTHVWWDELSKDYWPRWYGTLPAIRHKPSWPDPGGTAM